MNDLEARAQLSSLLHTIEAPVVADPALAGTIRDRGHRQRLRRAAATSTAVLVLAGGSALAALNMTGDAIPATSPAPGQHPAMLTGDWTFVVARSASGRVLSDPSDKSWLQFEADGRVIGHDGCNGVGWQAHITSTALTLTGVFQTAAYCDRQVIERVLRQPMTWAVTGDRLQLTAAGVTLSYRRTPLVVLPTPTQPAKAFAAFCPAEATKHHVLFPEGTPTGPVTITSAVAAAQPRFAAVWWQLDWRVTAYAAVVQLRPDPTAGHRSTVPGPRLNVWVIQAGQLEPPINRGRGRVPPVVTAVAVLVDRNSGSIDASYTCSTN